MTDIKKRATPVPQGYDRVLSGALKLPLADRVNLVKELKASIGKEVETLKAASNQAQEAAANI